jgi:hypothetical protein
MSWGVPAEPTTEPRVTCSPASTATSARYDKETLKAATGSMVTVFMPATDPANVTVPDTGARTGSPNRAE